MLSSVFVDRPRLAIVIAIVTTIAGALAYLAIPIAQYPDIVPPQVSVTTFYPGASSAVVDATIAQPIEAQVVGVDKMIYMKSTSGDDGSYSLIVSFELGTDPDINTVNVNNRVQIALSLAAAGSSAAGRGREEEVVRFARRYHGILAEAHARSRFSVELCHDQSLDSIKSTPGVGDASLLAAAGLCDACLGQHRPLDRS